MSFFPKFIAYVLYFCAILSLVSCLVSFISTVISIVLGVEIGAIGGILSHKLNKLGKGLKHNLSYTNSDPYYDDMLSKYLHYDVPSNINSHDDANMMYEADEQKGVPF